MEFNLLYIRRKYSFVVGSEIEGVRFLVFGVFYWGVIILWIGEGCKFFVVCWCGGVDLW